jgi:hypothetical protein
VVKEDGERDDRIVERGRTVLDSRTAIKYYTLRQSGLDVNIGGDTL